MATDNTSATFEIRLEDGTSGPAESAASALRGLRSQIDADTKALAGMQRAMKNLQLGSSVNVAQFRELKQRIDEKKQAIAQAQSAYIGLGGSFTKSSRGGKSSADMFALLSKNAAMMPGPLGQVVGRLGGLRGLLVGGAIALGLVAIAAAIVGVVAATVAATAALFRYGVAQADARRSELLRIEGLTKLRSWYGLAAGNAAEMQRGIDRVSGSVALGRDRVAQYSEQLYRAGLRGQNLTDALEAVAIKSAVQGEAAATAFAGWAAGAALAGHSVKRLADDVKARLGGIAAKQLLSLDVQARKARENFGALFAGLKIEGLLGGIKSLADMLSQSTASGRALQQIAATMLQPMVRAVEFVLPLFKRFFQGMIVGAQTMIIWALEAALWFKRAFGSDLVGTLDLTKTAFYAGIAAVTGLALVFGTLAAAIGLVVAPFALLAWMWGKVFELGARLVDFVESTDWAALGTAIIDGIVGGVRRGTQAVINAVKGVASSASSAFKSALGIASPSKVFAAYGKTLPAGVAVGINAGVPAVDAALGGMVSAPAPGSSSAARATPASITIGDVHIHSAGGGDARELALDFKRELQAVLEGVAISMGATVGGAAS